ncbi:hypothetical protein MLD38_005664 [Melastoma candidum]|uniref:Uncharacterized protein n=1 Tax=Melastoma candidum TaxID=119954 RepID=A0ACB9RLM3_9MYRT|nr:hypothetical protein MLD38_005664 [Melastoma candidum]
MLGEGVLPDKITFSGVTTACSGIGLADEVMKLYSCMIYLFRQAGTWTTHLTLTRGLECEQRQSMQGRILSSFLKHDIKTTLILLVNIRRFSRNSIMTTLSSPDMTAIPCLFNVHPCIVGTPHHLGLLAVAGVMCWLALRNAGTGCDSSWFLLLAACGGMHLLCRNYLLQDVLLLPEKSMKERAPSSQSRKQQISTRRFTMHKVVDLNPPL